MTILIAGEWKQRRKRLMMIQTELVYRTEASWPLFNLMIKSEMWSVLKWEGERAVLVPANKFYKSQ